MNQLQLSALSCTHRLSTKYSHESLSTRTHTVLCVRILHLGFYNRLSENEFGKGSVINREQKPHSVKNTCIRNIASGDYRASIQIDPGLLTRVLHYNLTRFEIPNHCGNNVRF